MMRYNIFMFGAIVFLLSVHAVSIPAQYSSYNYIEGFDQKAIPSASSILTDQTVDGRFGRIHTGGYLSPTPQANRRLNSGALFSPGGEWIGLNNNTPNSRFQPYWDQIPSTASSTNSNEILDMLRSRKLRDQGKADLLRQEDPRPVQATDPIPPFSERSGKNISYYSSGEYVKDLNVPNKPPIQPDKQEYQRNGTNNNSRQGIWMRAPVHANDQGTTDQNRQPNIPFGSGEVDLGSRIIGNIATPANPIPPDPVNMKREGSENNREFVTPSTPRQDPLVPFQEYLELMILRSPNVHPLSPIQVLFRNGTATIRGIVPSQEHRLEAGRILLGDSRVQKVDNRLTVLPSSPDKPLPVPFDPNLPK